MVYQYTRKKIAKIPNIHPNIAKIIPRYKVYFIPEIQRKWYTEYPYLSCNIPYTRFKKPLYTVYPKTLADPSKSMLPTYSLKTNTLTLLFLFRFEINEFPLITVPSFMKNLCWVLFVRNHLKTFHSWDILPSTLYLKICAGKFLHLIPRL